MVLTSDFDVLFRMNKEKFEGKQFIFYDIKEYIDLPLLFSKKLEEAGSHSFATVKAENEASFVLQWFDLGNTQVFVLCAVFPKLVPLALGLGIFGPFVEIPIFVNYTAM